ncbi:MAG: single-stranded-DNA-specific exonuclease RecJ [Chloroflexota bacterium]|nr:single-stranded-DNA-specific exonuclease RecJ [Chloroflexota bacterium]
MTQPTTSLLSTIWVPPAAAPADFFADLPSDVSPLIGQLLFNRGLQDRNAVDAFLSCSYDTLHNPLLLLDMDRAVRRIRDARERDETIAVYGDFDCDGVTATALLIQVFQALGIRVRPYIPQRIGEGYGLNVRAIELLDQAGIDLLITVDCGIANVAEVARANALGINVIVVDHHTPPNVLPDAYAIINPKQPGCAYPYKGLSGVGLAFKLIQALHGAGLRTDIRGRDILDLVALGTVSDMVPLDGENRVLVKHGLRALNGSQRPGICALIDASGLSRPLDARSIGFDLGPRINAAGRLDDAALAYELLLARDLADARERADDLNRLNIRRQELTKATQAHALRLIKQQGLGNDRVIVLDDGDFVPGIVGLVAGRLVDLLGRPVVVLASDGVLAKGSARSVAEFPIYDAFSRCADLFAKFGGHAQAAGCSLPLANVPLLRQALNGLAAQVIPAPGVVSAPYDTEISLDALTPGFFDELSQLEPFGQSCPLPVWVARGLQVVEARTMGSDKSHLKLKLRQGRTVHEAVWWGQAKFAPVLRRAGHSDALFTAERKPWQGVPRTQLLVKDIAV